MNDLAYTENQVAEAMQKGDWQTAERLLKDVIVSMPDNAEAFSRLGVIYFKTNRHGEAIDAMKKAIEIAPDYDKGWFNLAWAYYSSHRLEEATETCRKASKKFPEHLSLQTVYTKSLLEQGRFEEGQKILRAALELSSDNPLDYKNLGTLAYEQGWRDEAAEIYQKAIALEPDFTELHRLYSLNHKYKENDPHLDVMNNLLRAKKLETEAESRLRFSLAKAYEDIGDYETAFSHYALANALHRSLINYDQTMITDRFQKIKEVYSKSFFEERKGQGADDNTPIFIVGMPRSGTSLVEQILASHSKVYGAGERDDLNKLYRLNNLLENITFLKPDQLKALGEGYVRGLRRYASNVPHITDKMPPNFQHIGLIKAILPNAKIIHCRRDPAASGWSIYKRFMPASNMLFTFSLEDIAAYYRDYEDLMAYWHELLPGEIFDVAYEDLVTDQETWTRRLLEHCGLDWEDACLSFHETKRAVLTASALQVKQPVYTKALTDWQKFEPFLGGYLEAIKDYR